MFNYRGIIQSQDITAASLSYFVLVPALGSNAVVSAFVVAPKGVFLTYSMGDQVIVAEGEPHDYCILGIVQPRHPPASYLGTVLAENLVADSGRLSGSIRLSGNFSDTQEETLGSLARAKQEAEDKLAQLERRLEAVEARLFIFNP